VAISSLPNRKEIKRANHNHACMHMILGKNIYWAFTTGVIIGHENAMEQIRNTTLDARTTSVNIHSELANCNSLSSCVAIVKSRTKHKDHQTLAKLNYHGLDFDLATCKISRAIFVAPIITHRQLSSDR
jgi:hypothetical protein